MIKDENKYGKEMIREENANAKVNFPVKPLRKITYSNEHAFNKLQQK